MPGSSPRTGAAPNSIPPATQCNMDDVKGMHEGRGGSSGRGRESPALTGGQALSLFQARTKQPSA